MSSSNNPSWVPFILFYVVLILIITVLDTLNSLLNPNYWGLQVGLVTLGVGIFAIVGYKMPNLSPTASVLLAFTVGVLTIIPSILMGLGDIPDFWPQYFSIAGGMAAGSFLTFVFLAFSERHLQKNRIDPEEYLKNHELDL
jgi:hypothetical protein